jgi:hypothetical protein
MTIKEIAELCGVEDHTVRNWSKNVNCGKNFGSLQNLDSIGESGHGKAADLPPETAAAIVRAGGREVLAALLEENTRNKDALVVRDAPPAVVGVFANFTRHLEKAEALIERQSALLDDPRKAAYDELEKFVNENVAVDERGHHNPLPVWHLYHAYEKIAEKPLNEHDFMFKIALDHPEFKLVYKRKDWAFDRCFAPHFL